MSAHMAVQPLRVKPPCMRRFFSSLVQRAAKLHERNGGGSLTLLLVLPGTPATGRKKKKPDLSKYQHLSPEMRAKLGAALAGKADEAGGDSADTVRTEVLPSPLRDNPIVFPDFHISRHLSSSNAARSGRRRTHCWLQP